MVDGESSPTSPADPLEIDPVDGPVDAVVAPPGSKSITNRALVAAGLAEGTSTLTGALDADDTRAMSACLQALGVEVDHDADRATMRVVGCGGRLPSASAALDARLSGTTSRFVMPLLALGAGPYRLDGAEPLRARPMHDGIVALRALGATVHEEGAPGHLPVVVSGGPLPGGEVSVRGDASSQFLSGLLLVGPAMAEGLGVRIDGPLVSPSFVELTRRVMADLGAVTHVDDEGRIVVPGGGYRAAEVAVEPDAAGASYLFAAAAVTGGRVTVPGLGRSSPQSDLRFVDALEAMGATVTRDETETTVTASGGLRGVTVDLGDCSDTAQSLAVVAAFAEGPTEITGIGFIRRKETDRIAAVVTELRRCGVGADETPDGFVVHPATPHGASVRTYHDHRMAMSFSLLGLRVPGIRIEDPGCVAKTWPGWFEVLAGLAATARPSPGR